MVKQIETEMFNDFIKIFNKLNKENSTYLNI